MAESFLKLAEIKVVLKNKGFNYKVKDRKVKDSDGNFVTFFDARHGTEVRGKIVRSFNEGEVYHWPLLNHQNLAPLIDVLYIRDDLSIFLTSEHRVTLKEILHDEDFVYDRRCFERKRFYAKGIFSGLSYLHGKSLCLMNLTDDNIAVCKTYDRAIITNFSCLVCSRKTTRSKMKVPDLYKSPESEKGEFDAIAAEMWTSGTLMLDMFLSHMVPWAVVEYKPKKVIEIVEMLSLELLQAANVGSVVTFVDLAKYKVFLKCFFKQNPLERISARLASIASFLHPNRQDSALWIDSIRNPSTKLVTRNVKREYFIPNDADFADFPTGGNLHEDLAPLKYSDSINFCRDLVAYCKKPDTSKCKTSSPTMPCLPEVDERPSPIKDADTLASTLDCKRIKEEMFKIGASKGTTSLNICRQEKGNEFTKFLSPSFKSSNSLTASRTSFTLENTSKSCQMLKDENNYFNDSNYICYQSKSLSSIKPKQNYNAAPSKFCSRALSYSNVTSASRKQPIAADKGISDLCLDRLFGENKLTEVDVSKTRDQNSFESMGARHVLSTTKSGEPYTPMTHAFLADSYKRSAFKSGRLHRNDINQPGLSNEPDLPEIWNQIKFIRSCQITLRNHSRLFISAEFHNKQQNLLNEYTNLLHKEFLRLCRILDEKYQLKIEDLVELHQSFSSISKNHGNRQEALQQPQNTNIRYKASQNKLLQPEESKDILKSREVQIHVGNTKNCAGMFTDNITSVTPNIRLRRKYSYYRAVETSARNLDRKYKTNEGKERLEQAKSVFSEQNNSEDELFTPVTKFHEHGLKVMARKHKLKNAELKSYETKTEKEPEICDRMKESSKDSSKCRKKKISKKNANKEKTDKTDKKGIEEKNEKKEKDNKKEKNEKKERDKKEKNEKKEKDNKKEKNEKKEKNDKKMPHIKRERGKGSFFFSLCPGGRVEEPTPIVDYLCEECKLNLEMP